MSQMCVFDDFESYDYSSPRVVGTAFQCAVAMLGLLTPEELLALRVAVTSHALHLDSWDLDDRVEQLDPVGPPVPACETFSLYAGDGTAAEVEVDEEGDEVLEPTPLLPEFVIESPRGRMPGG